MEPLMGMTRETSGSERVSTKQQRIAELARQMPEAALSTLAHHIDIDAEMAEEDAKVLLVGSLNKDTLTRLDTYVTTRDPSTATRKETM